MSPLDVNAVFQSGRMLQGGFNRATELRRVRRPGRLYPSLSGQARVTNRLIVYNDPRLPKGTISDAEPALPMAQQPQPKRSLFGSVGGAVG